MAGCNLKRKRERDEETPQRAIVQQAKRRRIIGPPIQPIGDQEDTRSSGNPRKRAREGPPGRKAFVQKSKARKLVHDRIIPFRLTIRPWIAQAHRRAFNPPPLPDIQPVTPSTTAFNGSTVQPHSPMHLSPTAAPISIDVPSPPLPPNHSPMDHCVPACEEAEDPMSEDDSERSDNPMSEDESVLSVNSMSEDESVLSDKSMLEDDSSLSDMSLSDFGASDWSDGTL